MVGADVNETIAAFNANLSYLFDKHAPLKRSYIKEQSYPWITSTIKEMMRLRDEAHSRWRKSRSDSNKKYYKELKSIVITALFNEKTAYFTQSINNNLKNPRTLWKNIKHNLVDFNKKHDFDLPGGLNDPDVINNHFLNVPGNNNVSVTDLSYLWFNRYSSSTFKIEPVNEIIVSKIISKIRTNAKGADDISLDMILLTLPSTLNIMVILFIT